MSHIEFSGDGNSLPEFALPDPGMSGDLLSMVINLPDGEPFLPGPYIELGYTHFEVICVGAAGGRGGDGLGRPGYNGVPIANIPSFLNWPYTYVDGVQHLGMPVMGGTKSVYGGAGGGGGLHIVSGLLLALPDECSVVVGQAGDDAPTGQIDSPNTIVNPTPPYSPGSVNDFPGTEWPPPQSGEDGGASSFNGVTCRASGGKGGAPGGRYVATPGWPGYHNGSYYSYPGQKMMVDGKGGDGGRGGSTVAGGGAVGSDTDNAGADGTWDGAIGKGGGGGRGGATTPPPPPPGYGV